MSGFSCGTSCEAICSFTISCISVLPLGTDVDMLATTDPDFEDTEESETPVYEKHDKLLHGPAKSKQYVLINMYTGSDSSK